MNRRSSRMAVMAAAVLAVCSFAAVTMAQLEMDFYSKTCPNVEEIVRREMEEILRVAPTLAGPLLRLHFHDCFVRVRTPVAGVVSRRVHGGAID